MKKALVVGITGQDGSYLSEILLSNGYEVHGVIRRASTVNTERIDKIFSPEDKRYIHYGDLVEGLDHLIYEIQPDEIYNLGAMSHVRISFDIPVYTAQINALGSLRILESIRRINPKIKFYQASSSEMFGTTPAPQSELSPFNPVSPYGIAKLFAYHSTRAYRKGYGLFACNGILFNHESERRGINFVTRKITRGLARIKLGLQKDIVLGNLDAVRDWGHSKDYMEAVYLIMQHDVPDDFVVSTGESHTVREFLDECLLYLNLNPNVVKTDSVFYRPNEVPSLCGNSDKIRKTLGWKPKISFRELVKLMLEHDLRNEGYESSRR